MPRYHNPPKTQLIDMFKTRLMKQEDADNIIHTRYSWAACFYILPNVQKTLIDPKGCLIMSRNGHLMEYLSAHVDKHINQHMEKKIPPYIKYMNHPLDTTLKPLKWPNVRFVILDVLYTHILHQEVVGVWRQFMKDKNQGRKQQACTSNTAKHFQHWRKCRLFMHLSYKTNTITWNNLSAYRLV